MTISTTPKATHFVTNPTAKLDVDHRFWAVAGLDPIQALHIEGGADRDVVKARVRQLAKAAVSAKYAQSDDDDWTVNNSETQAVLKNGQPLATVRIPAGSVFVPSNPLNQQAQDAVFTLVRTLRPEERKGVIEDYAPEIDRLMQLYPVKFGISRFYVVGTGCMSISGELEDGDIVIDPDVQTCPTCPHDGICYHKLAAYQHVGVRCVLPEWTRDYFVAMSAVYEAALMGDKRAVFTSALTGILKAVARKDATAAYKAEREARVIRIVK